MRGDAFQRTALIGHRGVGKTSLLKRIEHYFSAAGRNVTVLDLDLEISKLIGKSTQEIFESRGEVEFRKLELAVFHKINEQLQIKMQMQKKASASCEVGGSAELVVNNNCGPVFLTLGAGFNPQEIPLEWKVIWIRRPSDSSGRIFFIRPRLNVAVDPLEEYQERFSKREGGYQSRADEVLILDEGLEFPSAAERAYFLDEIKNLGGILTVPRDVFNGRNNWITWFEKRIKWGVSRFELRNDILSISEIESAFEKIPRDKILLSFRNEKETGSTLKILNHFPCAFDWPVEFGPAPSLSKDSSMPAVLSLHERLDGQSLSGALARFPKNTTSVLKAALNVKNFRELEEGYNWQISGEKNQSQQRIFLPMSSDGRWQWFRQYMGSAVSLNFFRESNGNSLDQPTLLQQVRSADLVLSNKNVGEKKFAAVLGDPVRLSRSPLEHESFFSSKDIPFYAIQMSESEWEDGAIEFLKSLGLAWAAVTSPLKLAAFRLCRESVSSTTLSTFNTLAWNDGKSQWQGANTDLFGFEFSLNQVSKEIEHDLANVRLTPVEDSRSVFGRIAVWGGGGTLPMLRTALPGAQFFSLRTGKNRDVSQASNEAFLPDTVIWAVGPTRQFLKGNNSIESHCPPSNWLPRLVIDLNYVENSPGRAFALGCGSRYVSGLMMFKAQAEAQRQFWSEIGSEINSKIR